MRLSDAIRDGLTSSPKRLPSALLYDALGSMLFEAITFLPEYGVTRNYLDTLTALPWGKFSPDHLDLDHARAELHANGEIVHRLEALVGELEQQARLADARVACTINASDAACRPFAGGTPTDAG